VTTIRAWHFCDGWKLRDGTPLEVGRTYEVQPPLEMCRRGLHASKRLIDTLRYAPGSVLCRVELAGDIIRHSDKAVATKRTVLWAMDVERLLHYFACDVATIALERYGGEVDDRSWAAIDAKLGWLAGCVSDKDLAFARAAAWPAKAAAWAAAAWPAYAPAAAAAYAAYAPADAAAAYAANAAKAAAWAANKAQVLLDEMNAHLTAMVEDIRQ
jgi:hypothetical protein